MRPMKKLLAIFATAVTVGLGSIIAYAAGTAYDNPNVTISPNGVGWTTNAYDQTQKFWQYGTEVVVDSAPTLKQTLSKGEHYYKTQRQDVVPVEKWVSDYPYGRCMHSFTWHDHGKYGHTFNTMNNCLKNYYTGWIAYCADCHDTIDILMYAHIETVSGIGYLPTDKDYYYLCPWCKSMEQGAPVTHTCKLVSKNQYRILYDANTGGQPYGGHMSHSLHMYDNATEYDGEPVSPITRLSKNTYYAKGMDFIGWNTKPDGSGLRFDDEATIYNLCDKDWKYDGIEGTITLYAQWRTSQSTLQIDPNGGKYDGRTSVTSITMPYGSTFDVNSRTLTPPQGALVKFDTCGAPPISDVRQTQHLLEWTRVYPFQSKLEGTVYHYLMKNGNVDTLKATWERDSVTLPSVSWPGHSFSGWYYDKEYTKPAGAPGDKITPTQDTTIYAMWATLTLYSKDNYSAYGGSGAVNLSWVQPDTNLKSYKLFQSTNMSTWTQISDADDIGSEKTVDKDFAFTGSSGTYTVPYTGLYTLKAYGAQGGNYGSNTGGKGGYVTGNFWLRKGEVLTYTVGGQNGFGGGGSKVPEGFSNGGGASTITSSTQGLLLTAGGGGGATSVDNGGNGGLSSNLRPDNVSAGQDGYAAGGGGYVGGLAGEHITHSHEPACSTSGTDEAGEGFYSSVNIANNIGWGFEASYDSNGAAACGHTCDEGMMNVHVNAGDMTHLFNINGGGTLSFDISCDVNGDSADHKQLIYEIYSDTGALIDSVTVGQFTLVKREEVALQCGICGRWDELTEPKETLSFLSDKVTATMEKKFHMGYQCPGNGDWHGTVDIYKITGTVTINIPDYVKGIYIRSIMQFDNRGSDGGSWVGSRFENVRSTYDKLICGYTEGEIVSSQPAYGGSSYISAKAYSNSQQAGQRAGNGAISIDSVALGFSEALYLNNVRAKDVAKPDMVDKNKVTLNPVDATRVDVVWNAPKDNGTTYYHKCRSYPLGSTNMQLESNITTNTLTSGVKGYYYLIDTSAYTTVNASNGTLTSGLSVPVTFVDNGTKQTKYLHVATVDVAGNIAGTTHIPVSTDPGITIVYWPIHTRQMEIDDSVENVYKASGDRRWYVRADGKAPILLKSHGYMDGVAWNDYQPDNIAFEFVLGSAISQDIYYAAHTDVAHVKDTFTAASLNHSISGTIPLGYIGKTDAMRFGNGKYLSADSQYTVPASLHGKSVFVLPRAGAVKDKWTTNWSARTEDVSHGITLIADGKGPSYHGTDIFEDLKDGDLIDRRDEEIILDITATDDLSGVHDFRVEITNTDNGVTNVWHPDADGHIRIDITEDEFIFSGDFIVTIIGKDNVGNETSEAYGATEFDLQTSIERILSPHDPIFKEGESGVLHISTWGYCDKVVVEFPKEFTDLNPKMDTVIIYDEPKNYREDDDHQFMIPLYAPEGVGFKVKVTAYKGDKTIEQYPEFGVYDVEGTVLDEIRDRLR